MVLRSFLGTWSWRTNVPDRYRRVGDVYYRDNHTWHSAKNLLGRRTLLHGLAAVKVGSLV
jgi:hypothetical protein